MSFPLTRTVSPRGALRLISLAVFFAIALSTAGVASHRPGRESAARRGPRWFATGARSLRKAHDVERGREVDRNLGRAPARRVRLPIKQLPQRVEPPNPIAPWRFRVRATCCVAGSRSSIWLPRRMAVSRRTFTRPNFGNSETLGRNRLSRHFYRNP